MNMQLKSNQIFRSFCIVAFKSSTDLCVALCSAQTSINVHRILGISKYNACTGNVTFSRKGN